MGLLTRLAAGTRATAAIANSRPPRGGSQNVYYSAPGVPQTPAWDGLTATSNGYLQSLYVMRCARITAEKLASFPWRAGADPDKPQDHNPAAPLAQLLGPAKPSSPGGPNPMWSSRSLWIWSIVQRLICGRMAWETVGVPGSQRISALWPLVAPFIQPIPSSGGVHYFDGYQYALPTGYVPYTRDQVFYSWRPAQLDPRQPESVLQAAALPVSLQVALEKYLWGLAKNGMQGRNLVVTPKFDEDDSAAAFQSQFLADYTGYDNAGKTLFAELDSEQGEGRTAASEAYSRQNVQVLKLDTTPSDAQALALLQDMRGVIREAFGTPKSKLADSTDSTYANAGQDDMNWLLDTIIPLGREIADDINLRLAPRVGQDAGWFDFSEALALKPAAVFAPIAPDNAYRAGLITANDWRTDVGLPAIADGDKLPDAAQPVAETPLPPVDEDASNVAPVGAPPSGGRSAASFQPGPVDADKVHNLLAQAYPGSVLGWVDDAKWRYDPAVPLDEIKMARRPGGRDMDKVQGIADAVKAGKPMGPVVLVDTGEGKLEIADGYHRTLGFDRAGKRTIPALIGSGAGVHGPWEKDMHDAKLNRATRVIERIAELTGTRYDVSPIGLKKNWVTSVGGLPMFARAIAHALLRDGHSESEAIQLAIGVIKNWAEGKGNVSTKTRAKAAEALAEWERKKAQAHVMPNRRDTLTEADSAGLLLPKLPLPHLYKKSKDPKKCGVCGKHVTATIHLGTGIRDFHPDELRMPALPWLPDDFAPSKTITRDLGAPRPKRPKAAQARSRGIDAINAALDAAGFRHAGPAGHHHTPTGHLAGLASRTRRLVDAAAAGHEQQLASVMRGLFAKQSAATLSRLNGRRGQQMMRSAGLRANSKQPDEPEPPAATPPSEVAPVLDTAAIFDLAHWVDETRKAVTPVFDSVQGATTSRLAKALHPGTPVFPQAIAAAQQALLGRSSKLADTVSETTYQQIAQALAEGVANGEGVQALAKRVRAVFDEASQNRAETIARTEVMSATNTAQDAYATALPAGVVTEKQWLATPDSRTRPTHREANGQRQPIRQPFMVGGVAMQHPGDEAAPPDEWINCRCTTLYIPARAAKPAIPALPTTAVA